MTHPEYILTLSCLDQRGIVHRVSGFLAEHGCNIIDSAQFGDAQSHLFFMRVHFAAEDAGSDAAVLRAGFAALRETMQMSWQLHDARQEAARDADGVEDRPLPERPAVPLQERPAAGRDSGDRLEPHGLLPAGGQLQHPVPPPAAGGRRRAPKPSARRKQKILEIVQANDIDLVVLARYMQILSPELCDALAGRAINIHHSFLPSFKGAKPYYQAHERGVKLIGATAHFVTGDLDEGPIIEQDVERVDHAMEPETLTAIGRDVECVVLARAVKWFVEHRILLNGHKTVVFK